MLYYTLNKMGMFFIAVTALCLNKKFTLLLLRYFSICKQIHIFGRNVAEKIWNKLTHGN